MVILGFVKAASESGAFSTFTVRWLPRRIRRGGAPTWIARRPGGAWGGGRGTGRHVPFGGPRDRGDRPWL